ncbi:MAG: tetratricopeptide repeat protein [Candidatus Zixiibacteriota bacterium]
MSEVNNSVLERAQRLFEANQFLGLVALFEGLAAAEVRQLARQDKLRLYFIVASAYLRVGKVPAASRFANMLVKACPDDLGVLHLAAQASCGMAEYDRTIHYAGRYFEALEAGHFSQKFNSAEMLQSEVYRLWGRALKESGQPDEAVVKFLKAIEAKSDDSLAYLDLSHFYFQVKKYGEAGEILAQGFKKAPQSEELLKLAESFCATREGAAVCLKVFADAGKWSKVLTVLEKHSSLRALAWAKKFKAQALAGLGQWEEAKFLYEEYLSAFLDDWEVLNELGNVCFHLGEFDRAEECYRRALERNPAWEEGWRNLSVSLSRLGKLKEARASLEQYITLVPEDKTVYGFFADLLYRENEFGRAVNFYEDFLRFHPAEKEAWVKLADCYLNLGHTQSALSSFRQAHTLSPESDEIRTKMEELRRQLPKI